jgi:hypothetical protein
MFVKHLGAASSAAATADPDRRPRRTLARSTLDEAYSSRMGILDGLRTGEDDDSELMRALQEAAQEQTPERVKRVVQSLGEADAYLLSVGGSPTSPNARTMVRNGAVWTLAFSSAARAARRRRTGDLILRAPMSLVCTVAVKTGQAGVFLNPGDAPWILINGAILKAVAAMKGSSRPITMVDVRYTASLGVEVADDGTIEVEGVKRTLAELRVDLETLAKRNGVVQYGRARPNQEPSGAAWSAAKPILDLITELKLPVTLVERKRPSPADLMAEDR